MKLKLAFLAALTAAAAFAGEQGAERKLVVVKATYGDLPAGASADVTAKVKSMVNADGLAVKADNDNFGDPAPQVIKKLKVKYILDGQKLEKTINESETLTISLNPSKGVAEKAVQPGGTPAVASDAERKLADAMAASGNAALTAGNQDKAKDFFYKALASTEECPDALYGLAKIFEKEGKPIAAGDFYVRASRLMQQEDKPGSPFKSKLADADLRIKALNPFAARFSTYMDAYAQELGNILKRSPDSVTNQEAQAHAQSLQLKTLVRQASAAWVEAPAAEKKQDAGSKDAQGKTGNGDKIANYGYIKQRLAKGVSEDDIAKDLKNNGWPEDYMRMSFDIIRMDDTPSVVPPDVEVWLKKKGWTKITGKWTRKAEGIFEVTDGRLEAAKTNGAVDVIVQKGFTKAVAAFVRNANPDYELRYLRSQNYHTSGFGMVLKGSSCVLYGPTSITGHDLPYLDHEEPLPDWPKNEITVQVQDTALTYSLNGKSVKNANYKIGKDGPFVLEVVGTATLENPRCMGN